MIRLPTAVLPCSLLLLLVLAGAATPRATADDSRWVALGLGCIEVRVGYDGTR